MRALIIFIVLLFTTCTAHDRNYIGEDCGLIYDLSEMYFNQADTLKFEVHFFFMSEYSIPINSMQKDKEFIINVMNKDFKETKIQFQSTLNPTNIVDKDIANNMEEFDGHSVMFSKREAISVFVYPRNSKSFFQGKANKIPGYSFGVKQPYLKTHPHILSHEMGHVLGLYHTHQPDSSIRGNTSQTGDKVCDTPKSQSLLGHVTDKCEVASFMNIDRVLVSNYMSYVPDQCRKNFTKGQVERMKWVIENSKDLIDCLR